MANPEIAHRLVVLALSLVTDAQPAPVVRYALDEVALAYAPSARALTHARAIAAATPANPAYELWAATSDITKTLEWLSLLWPTMNKESDVTPTIAGDSTI